MSEEEYLTIAISIGRNIGQEPMPLHVWEDFRSRVYNAIKDVPKNLILANTQGKGEYYSSTGVIYEEVAIFLAQIPEKHSNGLQVMLAGLGFIYCQDGIGYTAANADSTFVTSAPFNTIKQPLPY